MEKVQKELKEYSTMLAKLDSKLQPRNYQKKKEIGTLFKPTRNLTNIYGFQNMDSNLFER